VEVGLIYTDIQLGAWKASHISDK